MVSVFVVLFRSCKSRRIVRNRYAYAVAIRCVCVGLSVCSASLTTGSGTDTRYDPTVLTRLAEPERGAVGVIVIQTESSLMSPILSGDGMAWAWGLNPAKCRLAPPHRQTDWPRIRVNCAKFSNSDRFCSQNV